MDAVPVRAAKALLLAAACLCVAACSPGPQKYGTAFLGSFDTTVQVVGYEADEREFSRVAEDAQALMVELHRLFDIYNSYPGLSNLKTVNDMAGKAPVEVDARILDLVEYGIQMHAQTGGAVNIALGPILKIWHDYRAEGREVPPSELLEEASALCDIGGVRVDREAGTLFLTEEGMSLDVGACAKGYASGLVAASLPEGYLLNAGGNVVASGLPADGRDAWEIGIQNPETSEEAPIVTLAITEGAVVTSGDYQRSYTVDGVAYHHIIDPATLMPADYFRSVSVIGADSALCDVLSTALFTLPKELGEALVRSLDCEAIWILKDMSIEMTDGARAILKDGA